MSIISFLKMRLTLPLRKDYRTTVRWTTLTIVLQSPRATYMYTPLKTDQEAMNINDSMDHSK